MVDALGWAYFEDGHKEPIMSFTKVDSIQHIIFYTPFGKYSYKYDRNGYHFAKSITKYAGFSFSEGTLYEEDWIVVSIDHIEIKTEHLN